jgi:hypothetical protein
MSDFQQLAQDLAPVLVTLTDEPYWACLCGPPAGPENTPNEPVFEFWVGAGFDDWFPEDDCTAIFAVMTATACTGPLPPSRGRRSRAWKQGRMVCAVSREGEAYCTLVLAEGRRVAEGEPHSGRLLDSIRSKFGLAPGPPSAYDLDIGAPPGHQGRWP